MYDFIEIVFTQNKSNVRLSKYSILFIILIVKTHENIWFNNLTANYKPPFLGIMFLRGSIMIPSIAFSSSITQTVSRGRWDMSGQPCCRQKLIMVRYMYWV